MQGQMTSWGGGGWVGNAVLQDVTYQVTQEQLKGDILLGQYFCLTG